MFLDFPSLLGAVTNRSQFVVAPQHSYSPIVLKDNSKKSHAARASSRRQMTAAIRLFYQVSNAIVSLKLRGLKHYDRVVDLISTFFK